jgi:protein TonB
MANGTMPMPTGFIEPVANDRLKNSFNSWFWGALLAAAALHFGMLAFWPEMTAEDVSIVSEELTQVDVVQEFEIPPPPEQIARPAIPVISADINISEDITIGEVTFNENPVSDLPPPPTGTGVSVSDEPAFVPMEVRPALRNTNALATQLQRRYPTMLKDAGIQGTTTLWVRIDERGDVIETRVFESSGYEQFDTVAQDVMATVADFSPAQNRDQNVAVWIQIPVVFQIAQ